ncbi:MAG: hypothetical protein ACTSXD_07150 [Candidatus Heimdallarchaeaceae archaeon]
MIKFKLTGVKKIIKNISGIKKELKNTDKILQTVAVKGLNKAKELAPYHKGFTQSNIIYFKKSKEVWVIQSNPPSDHDFPTNIVFEKGEFGNMTMWGSGGKRVPFKPKKAESVHFWTKTYNYLITEFSEQNIEISKRINHIWQK